MIEPALTAEEWEEPVEALDGYVDWNIGTVDVRLGGVGSNTRDVLKDRHKLAALALYGQPFGFTREMVTYLRESFAVPGGFEPMMDEIIDRIEALLPPENQVTDEKVKEYAQYLADRIDVTILLQHRDGLTRDEADARVGIYLRDEGWQGRKYPLDFFTINSFLSYPK